MASEVLHVYVILRASDVDRRKTSMLELQRQGLVPCTLVDAIYPADTPDGIDMYNAITA